MARVQLLDYTIHLRDAALVAEVQAALALGEKWRSYDVLYSGYIDSDETTTVGSFRLYMAPAYALLEFGDLPMVGWMVGPDPIVGTMVPSPPTTGPGYMTSAWFNNTLQRHIREQTRSTGWWLFGKDTIYRWGATVVLAAGGTTPPPPGPAEPVVEVTTPAKMGTRRWIYGAETNGGEYFVPPGMVGGSGVSSPVTRVGRAFSRATDGWGMGVRADESRATLYTGTIGTSTIPTVTTESWERFYVRLRSQTKSGGQLWVGQAGAGQAGTGIVSIDVTPTGQLALYRLYGFPGGIPYLLGASTVMLPIDKWARIDVVFRIYAVPAVSPAVHGHVACTVYLNGASVISGSGKYSDTWPVAPNPGGNLAGSTLGGGATADLAADFDDWMCASPPEDKTVAAQTPWDGGSPGPPEIPPRTYAVGETCTAGGSVYRAVQVNTLKFPPTYPNYLFEPWTLEVPGPCVWVKLTPSIDWINGSRMQLIRPDSIESGTGWTGIAREVNVRSCVHLGGLGFSSSTSGAELVLRSDSIQAARRHANVVGMAAAQVSAFADEAQGTTRAAGYKIGTDPVVFNPSLKVGFQSGQWIASSVYGPGPLDAPMSVPEISIAYRKEANTSATRLMALVGVIELIGKFGPEDLTPDEVASGIDTSPAFRPDIHHAPYPFSPWATAAKPAGPVIVRAATYVGNGTTQDLVFPAEVCFLWIRSLTGSTESNVWWPSQQIGKRDLDGAAYGPPFLYEFDQDPDFVPASGEDDAQCQFRLRLSHHTATTPEGFNKSGVTYQYVAVMDPAHRFYLADAYGNHPDLIPFTHALVDPAFDAEAMFILREQNSSVTGANMWWQGLGLPANEVWDLTQPAGWPNAIALTPGQIGPAAPGGFNGSSLTQYSFLLLRRDDLHPETEFKERVMALGTYVGNGVNPRVIPVTPPSGRRPMFLMVKGSNTGNGWVRDPSHTGTFSGSIQSGGAGSVNGIMAGGVDEFTVGANLNGNGIVYSWFLIPGCEGAGTADGWASNAECVQVPTNPVNGTEVPTNGNGNGNGGDGVDPGEPGTDISPACVAASTRIVNLALQEIGITKAVTSLGLDTDGNWIDTSQEAYAARMVYVTLVDSVLRDFPWSFATEYATLAWLAGTPAIPVNPDWTYSYTLPTNCLRVRRVCDPVQQRRYTPTPIPFDVRAIALGQTDVLLCHEPGAGQLPRPATGAPLTVQIEYTKRIDCPARVRDSLFRECLVFRLAAALAKGLGRDAKDADRCLRNYALALPRAKTQHANDQEPQPPMDGDPDWIRAR